MTGRDGRIVEIEFDGIRLLLLAAVAGVLLAGAFWLGRWTAPAEPRGTGGATAAGASAPGPGAPVVEPVEQGETVFDRAGATAEREPGRQVTGERTLGRFLLDCGVRDTRAAAERVRAALEQAGLPADVIRGADGRYRTLCGPFSTRDAAGRAARRAGGVLGAAPRIVEERPAEGP